MYLHQFCSYNTTLASAPVTVLVFHKIDFDFRIVCTRCVLLDCFTLLCNFMWQFLTFSSNRLFFKNYSWMFNHLETPYVLTVQFTILVLNSLNPYPNYLHTFIHISWNSLLHSKDFQLIFKVGNVLCKGKTKWAENNIN